jgi:CBS domain-containing protein
VFRHKDYGFLIPHWLTFSRFEKHHNNRYQKAGYMQIREIMTTNVEVVAPDTLLMEAVKRMLQLDCGSIFVAKDDRLVGIITDRDIAVRCVAGGQITPATTAAQVMSPELPYCRDTDTTDDVTKTMEENRVRRLTVFDGSKRLVGHSDAGRLVATLTFSARWQNGTLRETASRSSGSRRLPIVCWTKPAKPAWRWSPAGSRRSV